MGFQLTYDIWKYQSFRRLFFAGFLTSISRWFEFLTFSIISWELTGNAAIVGYIMTARFVALAISGVFFSKLQNIRYKFSKNMYAKWVAVAEKSS